MSDKVLNERIEKETDQFMKDNYNHFEPVERELIKKAMLMGVIFATEHAMEKEKAKKR